MPTDMHWEETFRAPSEKALAEIYPWLDAGEVKALRAAMKRPITFRRGRHRSHAIAERMRELDKLARTYGVECIKVKSGVRDYLNVGEAYQPTVMVRTDKRGNPQFTIASWAGVVESSHELTNDKLLEY